MRFKTSVDNGQMFFRILLKQFPKIVDDVLNSEEWQKYTKTNIYEPEMIKEILGEAE